LALDGDLGKRNAVSRIIEETIVGGRVLEDLLIPDEQLNCKKCKG